MVARPISYSITRRNPTVPRVVHSRQLLQSPRGCQVNSQYAWGGTKQNSNDELLNDRLYASRRLDRLNLHSAFQYRPYQPKCPSMLPLPRNRHTSSKWPRRKMKLKHVMISGSKVSYISDFPDRFDFPSAHSSVIIPFCTDSLNACTDQSLSCRTRFPIRD